MEDEEECFGKYMEIEGSNCDKCPENYACSKNDKRLRLTDAEWREVGDELVGEDSTLKWEHRAMTKEAKIVIEKTGSPILEKCLKCGGEIIITKNYQRCLETDCGWAVFSRALIGRPLSKPELLRPEILKLKKSGMTQQQIAKTLKCSQATVSTSIREST